MERIVEKVCPGRKQTEPISQAEIGVCNGLSGTVGIELLAGLFSHYQHAGGDSKGVECLTAALQDLSRMVKMRYGVDVAITIAHRDN